MNADTRQREPEVADPSPLATQLMPADWLSEDEMRLLERLLQGRPPLMLSQQHEDRLIGGGYLAWEGDRLLPTRHTIDVMGQSAYQGQGGHRRPGRQ